MSEIDKLKAELEKLKAIVADVQNARNMKFIGPTGGGDPSIYYSTEAIENAVAGLGRNSQLLEEKKSNE